ncbi:GNAT family N-acetyltransferase [Paracoccus sp. PS-1]|uniref:GNAT family N-acetyltransferase n=1 Tax=unclassified Paracoccus (in: a-proteobacteria) TaxID=2688777 RepID=UPI00049116E2|nr:MULTISPECIES: GNAT family N-acetyltransferase [unclassified Paracoccus (in: a-proteobacteria)]MDQ7261035.1 GNAT family N-acetyltransferase [Paracoccus sp. PS1]RQP06742.1 MAG: GNAT family N-acetyltransferase [Paracoccus sp. BP8]UFM65039.1 GNAT family N-acetyltransferase [Paracoccus sp. MA]
MIADPDIARAFESTWPAAEYAGAGGFLVGRGRGGGGRVSSARAARPDWDPADIPRAEAIQRGWDERPMFRVADSDAALAQALAARGYRHGTPTAILAADCAALTARPVPPLSSFEIWPPLAMQRDIWSDGNVTAARQAVMERVALPKTALLGRVQDRAAGAAFVALDGPVAMVHAIEVVPALRRMGVAGWLIRMAASWAEAQGATRLALAVSRDNAGALAVYDRLGFAELGGYGYWSKD